LVKEDITNIDWVLLQFNKFNFKNIKRKADSEIVL
jgi:hypothetical protein